MFRPDKDPHMDPDLSKTLGSGRVRIRIRNPVEGEGVVPESVLISTEQQQCSCVCQN